jgi:hypothetical protein
MAAPEPLLAAPRVAILAPLGAAAIVLFGVLVSAQAGVLLLGAFAIAGAIARLSATGARAFAVRSRAVDSAVLGFLGLALLLLGLTTPLG